MISKPEDWLLLDELQLYVSGKGRHWSRAYIYGLMKQTKLPFFKYGSARVVLKTEVDKVINSFSRPSPPKMMIERRRNGFSRN